MNTPATMRKINRSRLDRQGQALLECAVFGALAVAAMGFLIRIGMSFSHQQDMRMAAFRRAERAAYWDNNTFNDALGTNFYYIIDRQMANPNDSYFSLERNRYESSGFVMWGNHFTFAFEKAGDPDNQLGYLTQPLVVVRSNGEEKEYRQNDFPDDIATHAGAGMIVAFRGGTSETKTTHSSWGTISQRDSLGHLTANSETAESTLLNLRAPERLDSTVKPKEAWDW